MDNEVNTRLSHSSIHQGSRMNDNFGFRVVLLILWVEDRLTTVLLVEKHKHLWISKLLFEFNLTSFQNSTVLYNIDYH